MVNLKENYSSPTLSLNSSCAVLYLTHLSCFVFYGTNHSTDSCLTLRPLLHSSSSDNRHHKYSSYPYDRQPSAETIPQPHDLDNINSIEYQMMIQKHLWMADCLWRMNRAFVHPETRWEMNSYIYLFLGGFSFLDS